MLTRTPPDAIEAPQAARLAGELVLLLWHQADDDGAAFQPCLGRASLPRPHAAVRLDDAGATHAALVRLPHTVPAGALLQLSAGKPNAPAIATDLIAPMPDPLVASLPVGARARLLGFLLEMGVGLFRAGRDRGFARACRRIAATLHEATDGAERRIARIAADLPGGLQLIVVPAGDSVGAWHLLRAESACRVPAVAADGAFHLLTRNAAAGDTLQPADGTMPWRVLASAGGTPHLLGWLRSAPAVVADAVDRLYARVTEEAAPQAPAAALRRELALMLPRAAQRHDDAMAPVAAGLDLSLPDGQGGLFLRGWISDPHALVRTLTLRLPWRDIPVAGEALHRFARAEPPARLARGMHAASVQGIVAHLPDIGGDAIQPVLTLGLGSGADITLVAPPRAMAPAAARDAVLASVPPAAVTDALMDGCLAPAAARLHAAAMAAPRTTDLVRIGAPPSRPRVSVLIPLYRNLSFVRAQVAAFACDHAWRTVETIFVLDSPEQRHEVEHLLRGLSLMHGIGFTLVVMPRNLGYAAANNEGAAAARGQFLLLLNSDVVPDRPGWLAPMLEALADRRLGAAGPKLLFEDASIQHAGLFFDRGPDGTWLNRHYFKGFPRHFAMARRMRRVPAATGAALMVQRALYEQVGGITEDYIIGDYEDSDFCLKLRAAGREIAYVPQAELWHFERRSIRAHPGYARTLASLYNRRLHHARWDAPIAALMRRFAPGAGA